MKTLTLQAKIELNQGGFDLDITARKPGMGRRSGVLDLSAHRAVRPNPYSSVSGPTASLIDGVRRQPKQLEPLLQPAQVSQVAEALPEPEVTSPTTIPWKPLLIATAASATLPLALMAAPLVQNTQIPTWQSPAKPAPQALATPISTPPATPIAAQTMTDMQKQLDSFVAGKPAHGISIINLKDGQIAGTNGSKQFISASIYKLFVAQTIYKMIDNGQLSLGTTVKGTGVTVDTCLNRMITVSDNACGVALGTLVGWEKQNANFKSAGYTGTELYKNKDLKTTANDTALLLKRLYDGTLLSPNSSNHFLGLLKSQKVNNRLPQGLPAGTVIAHKTGDLFGLLHDAGIVYTAKGDYIITVLSGPWPNQANGIASFTQISRLVYAEMTK